MSQLRYKQNANLSCSNILTYGRYLRSAFFQLDDVLNDLTAHLGKLLSVMNLGILADIQKRYKLIRIITLYSSF